MVARSLLPALGLVAALAAAADDRSSADRLDRMERELNQIQRQLYRNEVSGAPTPASPTAGVQGGAALDLQSRMDQLEAELRTLTGQVEELQNGMAQLKASIEKSQADTDYRLGQLEGTGSPSAASPDKGHAAADPDRPAPASGFLVAPDERPAARATNHDDPDAAPPPAGGELSVQDQYNAAFGLLRQRDYKGAEAGFKAFLKKNGSSPLASNAQYWLGETYFVREDYKTAAAQFADGYQKYPKGAKGPESLLKLGISLGSLGQKREACASFARLDRDFPTPAPAVKERETRERQHLGC